MEPILPSCTTRRPRRQSRASSKGASDEGQAHRARSCCRPDPRWSQFFPLAQPEGPGGNRELPRKEQAMKDKLIALEAVAGLIPDGANSSLLHNPKAQAAIESFLERSKR